VKKLDSVRHYGPEGKAVCGVTGNGILGPLVVLTLTIERTTCEFCREIAEIMTASEGRMG
jgi:hypothetical protein